MRLTVLSLNIWNYQRDWAARRERIAALIRDCAPDVAALQEVRRDPRYAFGRDQATQLARRTGLRRVYAPAMRYWRVPRTEEGLAILTPHTILRHTVVPLCWDGRDRFDPNRRIALHATLALPGGVPLDCWVTHLNQRPPIQDASAARLGAAIAACDTPLPPLLMGDFNAEPPARAITLLRESGLRDMWQVAAPNDPGNTYPAESPRGRIDYLFAAPGWDVVHMERVGVGGRMLSDHCGLLAVLANPDAVIASSPQGSDA